MSKLIDDLCDEHERMNKRLDEPFIRQMFYETKNGRNYSKKPMMNHPWYKWKNRIKDAIRILRGKSFAVHFKCDEK